MKDSSLPIFTVPSVILNRNTTFHKTDKKVVVEVPGKLIRQLVEMCDGTRSLNQVVNSLKSEWDESSMRGLIQELGRHDILIDSYCLSDLSWNVIENPPHFPIMVTEKEVRILEEQAKERHRNCSSGKVYKVSSSPLGALLKSRHSTRTFSHQLVEFQAVVDMLWGAYGENYDGHRTVPSAGALYPLLVHVALFKDSKEFSPGVYSVHMASPDVVGLTLVSSDTNQFTRTFVDPLVVHGSCGVIVISGSFNVTGKKYGNRSMLYVPLEAGHAAQNVHLVALEHDIATLEIGGFVEELLARAICLPKHYRPLTTIAFGQEGHENDVDDIETHWVTPMSGQYRPPFAIALARVSAKINDDWSYGRDVSPSLARTKAVAEAREWAACGCVPDKLIQERFSDLDSAIDPREIIRFHPAQYRLKNFPFLPFDVHKQYEWVNCRDELSGSVAHVLADHVYFPYYPTSPLYTYANSSGVAAHPEYQKAVETSTLELIERDAFMIAYLTKLTYPTVSDRTLPQEIRNRIRELKKIGFRVWVKDHSLDLAPTVFVFAQNEDLAYTTCASCSSFDVEYAVGHALMEVEASVLARLQNGSAAINNPQEVAMPEDHGALYEQRSYFHRSDFLVNGRSNIEFRNIGRGGACSWQDLVDCLRRRDFSLITVQLSLSEEFGGNNGLHVIRSIIPGLVPMTFGYRQEPAGMDRIYAIAKEFGVGEISYRDLPRLPHPFA